MSEFLNLVKKFCGNKNRKNPFLKVKVKKNSTNWRY